MKTTLKNESETFSVGSKDIAEERKRNMQMRQFACAELDKQRDPLEVTQDLVSMGMEETQAVDLVNSILKQDTSVVQDKEEDKPSKSGIPEIVIGVGAIVGGLGASWASFDMAAKGVGGTMYIFYGLVMVGIGLLIDGIRQAHKNRNETSDK